MVRLKELNAFQEYDVRDLFQSQHGSIKSQVKLYYDIPLDLFQSQHGSIKCIFQTPLTPSFRSCLTP